MYYCTLKLMPVLTLLGHNVMFITIETPAFEAT